MSKKLISESQVNRWAKLSGVQLNESWMAGAREDEMPAEDGMAGEMGGEMPAEDDMGVEDMDMGDAAAEPEMTVEDDQLMSMIEKAVENVLVKMGLGEEGEAEEGDEGEGEEGGDALTGPDAGGEAEEKGEGEEEEEEVVAEMLTDEEIINETLKRVIKRLVK